MKKNDVRWTKEELCLVENGAVAEQNIVKWRGTGGEDGYLVAVWSQSCTLVSVWCH